MGDIVEKLQSRQATEAMVHQGCSIKQAQKSCEADSEEIDQLEKDIERLCMKLLMQQQPVARDLTPDFRSILR